jgi:hypothetical protein
MEVVSASQYHARPAIGAPRPRQASCGLILLRRCLRGLRGKATATRVSDVRRDCGQIVPEAAQRRGPRSEAGTKSIPNHLGLLCSPIRSSVAENSKTPNPRPPFSSSPVCLHASHTLAVPCCHPPPPPNATLLGGSTHRRLTRRPHRRIGPAVSAGLGHSCRPSEASSSQPVAEEGSEERESTARRRSTSPSHHHHRPPPRTQRRQTGRITPHHANAHSNHQPRDPSLLSLLQHSTLDTLRCWPSRLVAGHGPAGLSHRTPSRRELAAGPEPSDPHAVLSTNCCSPRRDHCTALHRALLDI